MNAHDLLERRAERGTARGAANVWADAQPHANTQARHSGTKWALRFALVAWAAIMGIAVILGAGRSGELETASADGEDQPVESVEPLPAPILVEGMNLQRVNRPWDPGFDASDLFGSSNPPNPEDITTFGSGELGVEHVIFASENDALSNLIFGIELFEDGGFRPWGANLGGRTLREFTDQLVQVEGEWQIAEATGLVPVARVDSEVRNLNDFGWQFDFVDGADEIILQAETRPNGTIDEWTWISRIANNRNDVTISEVEVLGRSAISVTVENDDDDQVVWVEDDFVYRLLASTIEGDTSVSTPASDAIDRLAVAEPEVWVDAVREAGQLGVAQGIALLFGLVLVAAVLVSLVFFAFRRHWRSAAISVTTLALLFFSIGFGPSGGPSSVSLLLAIAGLALAWFSYRLESS